jgi:hypothetical protein
VNPASCYIYIFIKMSLLCHHHMMHICILHIEKAQDISTLVRFHLHRGSWNSLVELSKFAHCSWCIVILGVEDRSTLMRLTQLTRLCNLMSSLVISIHSVYVYSSHISYSCRYPPLLCIAATHTCYKIIFNL